MKLQIWKLSRQSLYDELGRLDVGHMGRTEEYNGTISYPALHNPQRLLDSFARCG